MPELTVLMTAYNSEGTIRSSIRSILRQTFTDFELLVVDDGSRDGTAGVVSGIGDRRIRLVRLPENLGVCGASNAGLAEAKAPLIARMDSDDWSLPGRLEAQWRFFRENPGVDVVGTAVITLDEIRGEEYVRTHPTDHGDIRAALALYIPFSHSGVAYRRDAIRGIGGYSEAWDGVEDLELWIRAAGAGLRFANLPEPLHVYRISMATSRFHPTYSHFRRNLRHTALNLRAIRDLRLPKWRYVLALMRTIYPLLPVTVRRQVRRTRFGTSERLLTPAERQSVRELIRACDA